MCGGQCLFWTTQAKRHKGRFKVKKRNGKTVESSDKAAPSANFLAEVCLKLGFPPRTYHTKGTRAHQR